jgi:myo-inositol-1(or 4)-monophosphatase
MDEVLDLLESTARLAGHRVLEMGRAGFETYTKRDHSPVTSADLEANRILSERLLGAFPEDGWLSEETQDDHARLAKKRVWVIDPIDGTAYFMAGIPEYTISVALVEDQQPCLGVIYNPARDELFSARHGKGLRLNGSPLPRAAAAGNGTGESAVLLVSPPAYRKGRFRAIQARATVRPMGSIAYTLGLIAAGQGDGTINTSLLHEWDIAAGVLLMREAGGTVTGLDGNALSFNQPHPVVQGILAAVPGAYERLRHLASLLLSNG